MKMYSMWGGGGCSSKKSLKQNETEERELLHTGGWFRILDLIYKLKARSTSFDFLIEAYPHTCSIAYFCCNHSYKHNHNFRLSFGSENLLGMC